jgi:hypothetical protein
MQGENRADIGRDTFDQTKHFSRVLLQQGRVQIEADFNEQTGIVSHYLRTLATDLIGPHCGPGDGFQVQQLSTGKIDPTPVTGDFRIQAGHYYVQGILCELEHAPVPVTQVPNQAAQLKVKSLVADQTEFQKGQYVELFDALNKNETLLVTSIKEVGDQKDRTITFNNDVPVFQDHSKPSLRRITTYLSQPDFAQSLKNNPLETPATYLVYLDVWERHISYVEDEDGHNPSIREVALGGPDTATRARVIWQVKVHSVADAIDPKTLKNDYDTFLSTLEDVVQPGTGRLMARVTPGNTDDVSPCVISPESRYRGVENQLYRVEIHQEGTVGAAEATSFKWARENSAVIFPIRILGDDQATVESLGRDSGRSLQANNWVEIVDDDYVLHNHPESLRQVTLIDTAKLQVNFKPLKAGSTNPFGRDSTKHPLLRRWDSPDAVPVRIPSTNNGWIPLEDGIEIKFDPDGVYKTGDYWLIPTRTATGNVEWPTALDANGNPVPLPMLPHGIKHYYAPLAIITVADGEVKNVGDARRMLIPLFN